MDTPFKEENMKKTITTAILTAAAALGFADAPAIKPLSELYFGSCKRLAM